MARRTRAQLAADKLRTGRPPKHPSERHSEQVMVYLTRAERRRLGALARKRGVSLASLIMSPWRKEQ